MLADYGHGAVMAVPAHDQRDLDFARAFDLPVRVVVDAPSPAPSRSSGRAGRPTTRRDIAGRIAACRDDGQPMINSGVARRARQSGSDRAGSSSRSAAGTGRAAKSYRLRDWLISRQRYWGTPIPIVHSADGRSSRCPTTSCRSCCRPREGLDLKPRGHVAARRRHRLGHTCRTRSWTPARRDPDTMDTFVDSSWYFLRFLDPHDDSKAFDRAEADKWAPVDQYVGGVDHAILHLLYARFITKVLFDWATSSFTEPFTALLNQGMVLMDGSTMSKSKGNLVRLERPARRARRRRACG